MASGYTSGIEKGISFNEFIMTCARAFGALIDMRDEPMDAKIPVEFKPISWHFDALQKAKEKLSKVKNIPIAQANKAAKAEYHAEIRSIEKSIKNKEELLKKYNAMLDMVNKWKPPTKEHVNLKEFMRKQILDSIDFDCNMRYDKERLDGCKQLSGGEWKKKEIAHCKEDIAYHTKHWKEDVKRAKERTKWVNDLRRSLK